MFDSNSSRATYGMPTEISLPEMVTRSAIAFTEASSSRSYAWFAVDIATRKTRIEFTTRSANSGTSSHTRSCLRRLLGGFAFEDIAQAAQRDDAHSGALQPLAEAMDVDLHGLGARALAQIEDALVERGFRDRLSGSRDEHLEHRMLLRAQHEHLASQAEHSFDAVVLELAQGLQRARGALGAADDGVDARLELREAERFGQIVVGPEVEALDAGLDLAARGEDQHRHRNAAPAQPPQDFESVHSRQAQVEDHEVVALREQHVVRVHPVAHAIDRKAVVPQGFLEPIGQRLVVFGKKDAHTNSRADSTSIGVAGMRHMPRRESSLKGWRRK